MKKIYILSVIILSISCNSKKTDSDKNQITEIEHEIVIQEFQAIIDSADVKGSILIYDLEDDKYYSNNFNWARKLNLPASTFKIANSIIALETKVVENENTLFKWNGEERSLKNWEQDLTLKEAFHYSCVPCYQKIAREIGVKQMNDYLNKLDYGKMKVDIASIDNFWLEGESQINQFQQIEFLKRFYKSDLPISQRTETIVKSMMVMEENETFKLSGKTGWSIRNGKNNGWFVGFVETKENAYFFATNVEPSQNFNMGMFPMIRKELTYKALKQMKIMK